MPRRRYTLDDLQEYASRSGGKCLSKEYIDLSTPIKWRCKKGHTWDADFQIIRQGGWCRQCERQKKKEYALENIKKIVAKHGFKCLSTEYINDSTKLQFQCPEKNIWFASPNNIKNGSKCRKCSDKLSGLNKRDTIETYHKLARKRGGKCLSTVYITNTTKLKLQCDKGHVWQTSAVNIKTGRWCPKCSYVIRSENQKDSIEMYQKIAKERGGKCLSKVYVQSHARLQFQCSLGHKWSTVAIQVKRGSWCARCGHDSRRKKVSE